MLLKEVDCYSAFKKSFARKWQVDDINYASDEHVYIRQWRDA